MEPRPADVPAQGGLAARRGVRHLLIAFGWLNVAVGAVGLVVPGLPTTVFLLVALWAFSKSSVRFRDWLYGHPRFGPPVRAWQQHRVIAPRAKAGAMAMMALSIVVLALLGDWRVAAVAVAVMIPAAIFILTRASRPPG